MYHIEKITKGGGKVINDQDHSQPKINALQCSSETDYR